jgi:DNA-binding NtrC family response regulator
VSTSGEVLVLDDEAIVCDRIKEHLGKKGFLVETYTESQTALDRLENRTFDVVVTDIKMSGPTGLDVLRFVKKRSPTTQVIMITGYGSIETANEAEIVGAFDFICKPFALDDIHTLVKRAVKKAKKLR